MKLSTQVNLFSTVSFTERLLFTKHLDTMIKAGIPITEALETLKDQTTSSYFKKVLSVILSDIKNGQTLSKSLKKFPKIFDHFFVSMVEVGEESGTLDDNLSFLAKQLSKDFRLRKKIQGAMAYPAVVLFTMLIIGIFISLYILPKLVDFFSSFDMKLPLTTRILLFVSNVMKNYGIVIFAGLILAIILMRILIGIPKIKPYWHVFLLKLPLVGKLISYGQIARFARNLGTLIKSGVPISKGLDITANTLSNLKYKNDVIEVAGSLSKGKNIGASLERKNYYEFPPIVSKMIAIGEKTGKLDETLLYLARFYEDEIDDLSKNLSTIIEPVLLIIIGFAVGFLAISIISPIYELTGSIRR